LDFPLVNGRPSTFFQASRGLQQGCPLSPLLFIIVVDSLSIKLEKERENLNLPGLQIAQRVKNISHSQFLDETLFLGEASSIIVTEFKRIMDSFLDASGGEINNRKCQILRWNASTRTMR
jgi:hypothetical protein